MSVEIIMFLFGLALLNRNEVATTTVASVVPKMLVINNNYTTV